MNKEKKNLSVEDLKNLSKRYFKDAEILLKAGRYDGAMYLCGYALEIGLKKRICKTLKWKEFIPESNTGLKGLKTHNLEDLFLLSGKNELTTQYMAEWSIIKVWGPDMRYQIPNNTKETTKNFLKSIKTLLDKL